LFYSWWLGRTTGHTQERCGDDCYAPKFHTL